MAGFWKKAQAMFPWMPNELLHAYVDEWKASGSKVLAREALRSHGSYDKHFAGNKTADGAVRMSESDWMTYYRSVKDVFRDAGIPRGFYDERADIGQYVSGEVSIKELQARINDGVIASRNVPAEVEEELRRLYDVPQGALAAFFLDPDRAWSVIQQDWAKAQIAGQSRIAGYGQLTAAEVDEISATGIDPLKAADAFSEMAQSSELFAGSIDGSGVGNISREEQIDAIFSGDATARQKIARAREEKLAAFQGGGGAATGQQGIVGLGSSRN